MVETKADSCRRSSLWSPQPGNPSPAGHPPAVVAGFAGWLLDAFDFFLITFCLTAIAREFHKSDAAAALLITATMACRPLGGFLFGLLADRYGRRRPLMVNMGFFAIAGVLTGLVPNFTTLLIVRALFGIVMGGTWGVGASLAMESAPTHHRGLLSGVLQEGYAAGNVLAAVFYFFCFQRLGWRWLFILSSVPAIPVVLYIAFFVKESAVWQQNKVHTHVLGAAAPRDSLPLEALPLPAALHDRHDVRLAWHPGHVPHLSCSASGT